MSLDLELSKLLYEKGVRLETEKWFNNNDKTIRYVGECIHENDGGSWGYVPSTEYDTPSPSTDDLLAVLPGDIETTELKISKDYKGLFWVQYVYDDGGTCGEAFRDTLPEALAKMTLFLIDEMGYRYDKEKGALVK